MEGKRKGWRNSRNHARVLFMGVESSGYGLFNAVAAVVVCFAYFLLPDGEALALLRVSRISLGWGVNVEVEVCSWTYIVYHV